MSQKHFNYSKVSTAGPINEGTAPETLDEGVIETLEAEPETDIAPKEPVCRGGIVTGCARLNVRATPGADTDDNVICVIEKETKLEIDESNSTDEWFKVYLENGIEGFCMKKFIDSRV